MLAPRSSDQKILALNQIHFVVAKAARNGEAVRPAHEAARIVRDYPDCGMTPMEISERIFRLAVERRMAVDPSD